MPAGVAFATAFFVDERRFATFGAEFANTLEGVAWVAVAFRYLGLCHGQSFLWWHVYRSWFLFKVFLAEIFVQSLGNAIRQGTHPVAAKAQ